VLWEFHLEQDRQRMQAVLKASADEGFVKLSLQRDAPQWLSGRHNPHEYEEDYLGREGAVPSAYMSLFGHPIEIEELVVSEPDRLVDGIRAPARD
jgi:hypothetical protein